jgi:hypothetical protein
MKPPDVTNLDEAATSLLSLLAEQVAVLNPRRENPGSVGSVEGRGNIDRGVCGRNVPLGVGATALQEICSRMREGMRLLSGSL